MTVSSETMRSGPYTGDGSTGQKFPVTFQFHADDWVVVLEDGVVMTLNTDYELTGAGEASGGEVTWIGATTLNSEYEIVRSIPRTQDDGFANADRFPAETFQDLADRLTMMIQEGVHRTGDALDEWDAESQQIKNVADPTEAQDAATKTYVNQAIAGQGNVPAPLAGEVDYVLKATGAGAFDWAEDTQEVPDPVAADAGKQLAATGASAWEWQSPILYNALINGDMRIAQRGASIAAPNDAAFLLDRWKILSDGNGVIDADQETTTIPDQSYASMKLTVNTANKKFGIYQIIEARDAKRLIGKKVSLSFKTYTPTGKRIRKIRASVMSWTSTEDVPVADPITSWNAQGTNPSHNANFTTEGIFADFIDLTVDTWETWTLEGVNIDTAGAKNVAVFIWVDDTDAAAGDELYITDVQLELGDNAHDTLHRPYQEELTLCERFYEVGDYEDRQYNPNVAESGAIGGAVRFRTRKRAASATIALTVVTETLMDTTSQQGSATTDAFVVKGNLIAGAAGKAQMDGTWTADSELP